MSALESMVTPEQVQNYIAESLRVQAVGVAGDGQHFEALIVSEAFAARAVSSATSSSTRRWASACARRSTRCRCGP